MDLIEDYFQEKEGKGKIVLSKFFEEKNVVITGFCNNFLPDKINLNLQEICTTEVNSFADLYPQVKLCLGILLFTLYQIFMLLYYHRLSKICT